MSLSLSLIVGTPSLFAQDESDREGRIRAEQLLVRGMTRAYLGEHTEALQLYQQALPLARGDAAIHAAIAASYEATSQYASAITFAEQAITLAPEQHAYYTQLANLFLLAGNREGARSTLERLLVVDPANLDALFELAYVQHIDGDFSGAIATYRLIETHTGPALDIKFRQLQLYQKMGDHSGAEATLREMITLEPENVTLYQRLSEAYLSNEQPAEARHMLETALEFEPANVDLIVALATEYRKEGQGERADSLMQRTLSDDSSTAEQRLLQARYLYNESRRDSAFVQPARALLERITRLDTPTEEAWLMLGEIQIASGALRAGGESIYQALTLNPRSQGQWSRSAWAFLEGGMAERSAEVAEEALMLFPGDIELLRISGLALLELDRNEEAVDRLAEAIELTRRDAVEAPMASDLYAALGMLYGRLGHIESADAHYEQAIEVNPNNVMALNNYAYSLAVRGDQLKKAQRYAEHAVATSPGSPSFVDTLAWVYFASGDYEGARALLEQALRLRGAGPAVHEHYGDVLHKLGRHPEARSAWEKALQMDPANTSLESKLSQ
ncbi:MAG: tetratricopeptide repeat protein [Rhodothermales bacterium]|nr:tetratricopeptide repeat protein [Rhodothermales bacterium]